MAIEEHTKIVRMEDLQERLKSGSDCLLEIYGKNLGRRVELGFQRITIGREEENDLVLDSESASRKHSEIFILNGERMIGDLGSTNGTFVNDIRVDRAPLSNGDLIRIGNTVLKFLAGSHIESLYYEEIHRMVITDGLTQIANKRHLLEEMVRELWRADRHNRDLSLILFDLDHFKSINDKFGHVAGDQILKELTDLVRPRIRKDEVFGRYGGEEFIVLLPETNKENALVFAESIRGMVESHAFHFSGIWIPLTISVGVAQFASERHATPEDFIEEADQALYRAKEGGRNRVCS